MRETDKLDGRSCSGRLRDLARQLAPLPGIKRGHREIVCGAMHDMFYSLQQVCGVADLYMHSWRCCGKLRRQGCWCWMMPCMMTTVARKKLVHTPREYRKVWPRRGKSGESDRALVHMHSLGAARIALGLPRTRAALRALGTRTHAKQGTFATCYVPQYISRHERGSAYEAKA